MIRVNFVKVIIQIIGCARKGIKIVIKFTPIKRSTKVKSISLS